MNLLVEPNYDDRFEDSCGDWADNMAEAFYRAIVDALHPSLRDDLKIDIATSLAHDLISTGDSKLCDAYGLTIAHAYCYLQDIYGSYEKEVQLEFQGYLSDRF